MAQMMFINLNGVPVDYNSCDKLGLIESGTDDVYQPQWGARGLQ